MRKQKIFTMCFALRSGRSVGSQIMALLGVTSVHIVNGASSPETLIRRLCFVLINVAVNLRSCALDSYFKSWFLLVQPVFNFIWTVRIKRKDIVLRVVRVAWKEQITAAWHNNEAWGGQLSPIIWLFCNWESLNHTQEADFLIQNFYT